jgi:DNA-binding response OmpR family regulator
VAARTALVVDDDYKSAELIRVQLETQDFAVLHAPSAEAALVLAVRQPLALIILDILLPTMDGWQFLERVRAEPAMRGVPVIVVSIVADLERGQTLGVAAVIQKPFSREALNDALTELRLVPRTTALVPA